MASSAGRLKHGDSVSARTAFHLLAGAFGRKQLDPKGRKPGYGRVEFAGGSWPPADGYEAPLSLQNGSSAAISSGRRTS